MDLSYPGQLKRVRKRGTDRYIDRDRDVIDTSFDSSRSLLSTSGSIDGSELSRSVKDGKRETYKSIKRDRDVVDTSFDSSRSLLDR